MKECTCMCLLVAASVCVCLCVCQLDFAPDVLLQKLSCDRPSSDGEPNHENGVTVTDTKDHGKHSLSLSLSLSLSHTLTHTHKPTHTTPFKVESKCKCGGCWRVGARGKGQEVRA